MRTAILLVSAGLVLTPALVHAQDSGMAGMHDQQREGGKMCFTDHYHWGNGTGDTKTSAQKAAIRSWIDFTSLEYGNRWASFANSASKKTSYTKEAKGWSATVESRPCRR